MWGREHSEIRVLSAAQRGDVDCLSAIIAEDRVQLDRSDDMGYTAAHWAAYYDELGAFDLLIETSPILLSTRTKRGLSPLHIACTCASIRVVRYICGENFGETPTRDNYTKDEEHVKAPFPAKSDLLDAISEYGETPLHHAAGVGNSELVNILLAAGANRLIQDKWKRSAAMVAYQNGYMECFRAFGQDEQSVIQTEEQSDAAAAYPLQQAKRSSILAKEMQHLFQDSGGIFERIKLRSAAAADTVEVKHMFHTQQQQEESQESTIVPKKEERQEQTTGVTDKSSMVNNINSNGGRNSSNSNGGHSSSSSNSGSNSNIYGSSERCTKKKVALSKLVEYPGDPVTLTKLFANAADIDINGKDMYGLTALHKFCAWDKVDLLVPLLAQLNAEDINTLGGGKDHKQHCLHICVEMDAKRALELLLSDKRVDTSVTDSNGKTYQEFAKDRGKSIIA